MKTFRVLACATLVMSGGLILGSQVFKDGAVNLTAIGSLLGVIGVMGFVAYGPKW